MLSRKTMAIELTSASIIEGVDSFLPRDVPREQYGIIVCPVELQFLYIISLKNMRGRMMKRCLFCSFAVLITFSYNVQFSSYCTQTSQMIWRSYCIQTSQMIWPTEI